MRRQVRLLGGFALSVVVVSGLFIYAMFQGGFVSWFLLTAYLPLFVYQLAFFVYPIRRWHVSRTLSRAVTYAGRSVTVDVTLSRRLPFPLYYCVIEEIAPASLQHVDHQSQKFHYLNTPEKVAVKRQIKEVIFPAFKRTLHFTYTLEALPRGVHHLTHIRIKTSDLLGFMRKECIYPVTDEFITYPNERQITLVSQRGQLAEGGTSSQLLNMRQTNVAASIREYAAGDKFSWINWKQTARQNKMITKEFEQERRTDPRIILDHCDYGSLNPLAFEGAIEVALALVNVFQAKATDPEVVLIGNPVTHVAVRGEALRQALARVTPVNEGGSFALKLEKALGKLPRDQLTVIVVTHIAQALMPIVERLQQRAGTLLIFHVQASQRTLPEEQDRIVYLRQQGLLVYQLTEHELVQDPIEVNG